jgi:hypothetical protein
MLKIACLTVFSLLLLNYCPTFAQKEANVWFFGGHAGVDFNAVPPRALTDSDTWSYEAAASISDPNGNLLFYTNGEIVLNRAHQVMVNGSGLGGHHSAKQGAVIMPAPGKPGLYYLFTSDARENRHQKGLRYSIIDMSRQNGLGEVVTKNVLLHAPSGESVVAVGGCGCDRNHSFWLLADKSDEPDKLYAYRLTENGITGPFVSALPGLTDIQFIRFSPTGERVAFVGLGAGKEPLVGIADFNYLNGLLNNVQTWPDLTDDYFRGVEFSPDGQLLYSSDYINLYQFDLRSGTADQIAASRLHIPFEGVTTMIPQLGPDGKLYLPQSKGTWTDEYLAALEYPNHLGLACSPKVNAIYLGGRGTTVVLPNFPANYFYREDLLEAKGSAGPDREVCANEAIRLGSEADSRISYQ